MCDVQGRSYLRHPALLCCSGKEKHCITVSYHIHRTWGPRPPCSSAAGANVRHYGQEMKVRLPTYVNPLTGSDRRLLVVFRHRGQAVSLLGMLDYEMLDDKRNQRDSLATVRNSTWGIDQPVLPIRIHKQEKYIEKWI